MKFIFLQICKKIMFSQFFKNSLNNIDINFTYILSINKNIIKLNNDINIKFLSKYLIDIALKTSQGI